MRARPAAPMPARSSGSRASVRIASASPWTASGATSKPQSSLTSSGIPPTFVATTGRPAAIASASASPKASRRDGHHEYVPLGELRHTRRWLSRTEHRSRAPPQGEPAPNLAPPPGSGRSFGTRRPGTPAELVAPPRGTRRFPYRDTPSPAFQSPGRPSPLPPRPVNGGQGHAVVDQLCVDASAAQPLDAGERIRDHPIRRKPDQARRGLAFDTGGEDLVGVEKSGAADPTSRNQLRDRVDRVQVKNCRRFAVHPSLEPS